MTKHPHSFTRTRSVPCCTCGGGGTLDLTTGFLLSVIRLLRKSWPACSCEATRPFWTPGCGTGRITARLLERLPRGRVVGIDLDPEMVSLARQWLLAGTTVIESGLLDLTLPEPVDVIFSTATFHWVLDQDELFARLATLLRPGGRLVA